MHVAIVQAHRPGTISVVGLPAGAYGVGCTTAAETGRDLPVINIDTGQPLSARLPAKGVITFQQK